MDVFIFQLTLLAIFISHFNTIELYIILYIINIYYKHFNTIENISTFNIIGYVYISRTFENYFQV